MKTRDNDLTFPVGSLYGAVLEGMVKSMTADNLWDEMDRSGSMKHYTPQEYLVLFREDLPSLILVSIAMLLTAWGVATADWVEGMGILYTVVAIALITSYLLTLSGFSDLFGLAYTTLFGLVTIWALSTGLLADEISFHEALFAVLGRAESWVRLAMSGGFSQDNLVFLLVLAWVTWYLTFNAVWNLFRTRRLWYATIPPGLALLINTYYYSGLASIELFLIAYLFLILLLAVFTNAANREEIWLSQGAEYSPQVRRHLLWTGAPIILILLTIAWLAPTVPQSDRLRALWEAQENPWTMVQDTAERLFSGVEGDFEESTPDYYGGASLTMGGPVSLSDRPVMYVQAPSGNRYYWRSKVFDFYINGRWIANPEVRINSDFGRITPEESEGYALRRNVQQEFAIALPATQLLYAAPQPVSFTSVRLSYDAIYTTPSDDFATITEIRARGILSTGDRYGVTSSISVADENSLRSASSEYPQWVSERYLQLPDNITARTYQLAASLAAPHGNPYDIARAVEGYLRANMRYNEVVDPPARGVEPVDYFLFTSQEGYCNYYSSAMVIMLRTVGVPARVSAGFAQGQYDPALNAFRVVEADAHTWVEVYFPEYGWIEFEPTAAEGEIVRGQTPEDLMSAVAATPTPFTDLEPPLEDIQDNIADPNNPNQTSQAGIFGLPASMKPPPWIFWSLVLMVSIFLSVAIAWYLVEQFGMESLSEVSRSYARLSVVANLAGIVLSPSDTPYERSNIITDRVPDLTDGTRRITQYYVEEQYARSYDERRAALRSAAAWRQIRLILFRHAVKHKLAQLFPWLRLSGS